MLKENEVVVGICFDNGAGSVSVIVNREEAKELMKDFQNYHEDPKNYYKVRLVGSHAIRLDLVVGMVTTNPPKTCEIGEDKS